MKPQILSREPGNVALSRMYKAAQEQFLKEPRNNGPLVQFSVESVNLFVAPQTQHLLIFRLDLIIFY